MVLGIDEETVNQQLASAREAEQGGQTSLGGTTATDSTPSNVYRTRDGREIKLPEGVTAQQVDALFAKMRSGGGPGALSAEEQAIFQRMRSAMGGGPGGGAGGQRRPSTTASTVGGDYIVFVMRNGEPTAMPIRTGLTDLDYSEVTRGLTAQDTVLILPSASLVQAQQEWANRMNRMTGGGAVPGMQRSNSSSSTSRSQ